MLENLFLTFGEIEYMTYFRSDIVHALQDVATWGPGQLNTFLKHYTSTLQTLYHSHPIIKRVISNCVHYRHYAIMTVDLTSGWKAHACGFDYFEVNFIRVRGRFASVPHCMARQPPTIKMWKARSGHLRIWGDVWHQCDTGRESDSDRALCQATLFDWHTMAPLFIVLLWMYKSGNAPATKEYPARVWTLEAPACLCQQTLLNWPVLATLPVRIALIFGSFVLSAGVLAVLAFLNFNWDHMKNRDR